MVHQLAYWVFVLRVSVFLVFDQRTEPQRMAVQVVDFLAMEMVEIVEIVENH